jgi:UDP-N-acetylglucosamine--N-acetylmuramyl-(pentapeptide) pyrophosphoryl-undecaprenol N-acetylglucosamine transferase
MNAPTKTILIMAGGTGGHVFPALAVAECFQEKGFRIEWLGTERGIEARLVRATNIPLNIISVSGVRGRGFLRLLRAPIQLMIALVQALIIIHKIKPLCVLGMGGFVTGPGGVAAWLTKTPLIIHEQNAIPGLTNTLLAKIADKILEAFPHAFMLKQEQSAIVTGNPIRRDIIELPAPHQDQNSINCALKVLVVGGSLGATAINDLLPRTLALMPVAARPTIKHQTGAQHLENTQSLYKKLNVDAEVLSFIDDMASAYAWADLVICRSGASTVSELSMAGVASILIPYPHAVDDHQTANALFLVRNNAAVLMQQRDISADELVRLLTTFNHDRSRLNAMALAARAQATPYATELVVEQCLEASYERAA